MNDGMRTLGQMVAGAGLDAAGGAELSGKVRTRYRVECMSPDGLSKWIEEFENLVTTVGKNKLLNSGFKTAGSTVWYVGLIDSNASTGPNATDTMSAHGTWTEITPYSQASRPIWSGAATASGGSIDNSAAKATFSITTTATAGGCFMVDDPTKAATTGTLYGAGPFSQNRAVASGDTINVTVTAQIT